MEHPYSSRLEIGLNSLPECLRVAVDTQLCANLFVRIFLGRGATLLKVGPQLFDRPVNDRIGGVIEHLTDNFTAQASVALALNLDKRRNAILIHKEMVDRPSTGTAVLRRD